MNDMYELSFSLFFFLVLADANFPATSICKCGPVEIRADGMSKHLCIGISYTTFMKKNIFLILFERDLMLI